MKRLWAYLWVSIASANIFAFAYVCVGGEWPFRDGLILFMMLMIANVSAIIVWPFYAFFGWEHSPTTFGKYVGIPTLLFILFASPFHPPIGFVGSYFVLLGSMIVYAFFAKKDLDDIDEHNLTKQ